MGAAPDTRLSTVPAVLARHASDDDGAEFLRLMHAGAEDQVFAYAELIEAARSWSARFAADGLEAGDRVIVILRHSADLYAAYLGALLGGQVPAMFSFPSPKFSEEQYFENVGALIAGAGARMVVAYPELAAKLADREAGALGDARLLTPGDPRPPAAEAPEPADPDPSAAAFVQYSSGTTGLKKGVVVSHRALLAQIEAYGDAIAAGPGDRIVSWLPLYHDMGLITCLFLPLLRKVSLVAMSPFDWVAQPALWPQAASTHRATLSWLPNFAYAFMAANVPDAALSGVDLSSLRGVVNCSEPVTAASHDAFVRRFAEHGFERDALASSYAMAENVFAVTSGGFGTPIPAGPTVVSSGRALPGTEIRIAGPDGRDVEGGQVGEVVLRSDCLMEGYDGNPEATAEAMRDGWYFSGDLGYLDGRDLYVTGRVNDLVIVGGRNVYPQDVEQVVHEVDGVTAGRVVAFGVRDERQGTEGLVVMAETDGDDDDEIRRAIHAAVAERTEVVPADILLVEPRTLLKSSSGKLARGANRELYLERRPPEPVARAAGGRQPSDLRGAVRDAVTRVARVATVADDQSILRSGLVDSFGMAELFAELEAATGVRLTADRLSRLDRLDTVAALAELLAAEAGTELAGPALEPAEIPMTAGPAQAPRSGGAGGWTMLYRLLMRRRGIRFGPGLRVLGPIHLQIEGRGSNVVLGRNVTLMPGAHIKNREDGRVVLHDGARLDSVARVVAANDATIELGENAALGLGTVINAGRDVLIGRNSFTAAHCVINASDHGLSAGTPMRQQPYEHAPILIGEDVWLGAGVLVSKGARIGHGAVVSAGAAVAGDVPAGAIVHGRPARVIKFRE